MTDHIALVQASINEIEESLNTNISVKEIAFQSGISIWP